LRAHLKVKFFSSFLPTGFYSYFFLFLSKNEGKWRGCNLPSVSAELVYPPVFSNRHKTLSRTAAFLQNSVLSFRLHVIRCT
jgi:hypothetical protein